MTDLFRTAPDAERARPARDAVALECAARALRARVLAALLRRALADVRRRVADWRGAPARAEPRRRVGPPEPARRPFAVACASG